MKKTDYVVVTSTQEEVIVNTLKEARQLAKEKSITEDYAEISKWVWDKDLNDKVLDDDWNEYYENGHKI